VIKSGEEQWYMLQEPTDPIRGAILIIRVAGTIHIKITHIPPKKKKTVHGFAVTIVQARDLVRTNGKKKLIEQA
jgi:hypothetical protein